MTLASLQNPHSKACPRAGGDPKMTKTLGVTGGIGSGKTAACRMLEDLGARVFYADQEARRLMQEDDAVRAAVTEAFGEESYRPDGALNRPFLAGEVFGREEKTHRLNRIVHPRVFEAFAAAREKAERDGVALLVHEAALIYEAGGGEHLDAVAVVDAPEAVRIARVMRRDGVTEAQVRARMGHQLPAAALRRRADYVLDNDGSLEDLYPQVERVYQEMTAMQTR